MFKNNGKLGDYNFNITTIEDQTRERACLYREICYDLFQVKHIVYVPNYAIV